ncbi:MAG: RHS repeat-associated core domain-containing protein [Limnobacter sp.]|uniref:RHS repeat-associated core domain-containing protein n=1 Tax=Limnobacter sp. TaxID=2003368 RepID=UPI00391B9C63
MDLRYQRLALLCLSLSLISGGALAETITRTSAFVYDTDGLLVREIIEPGSSSLCLVSAYTLDAYGNRTATETRNCNGSAIPGIGSEAAAPAVAPTTASVTGEYAQFESRTVQSSYVATTANPVAGQFPSSNTNTLGHSEKQEFDNRFGTLVKQTGPNNLTTTWAYDTFGRKVRETRADGTKTYWEYVLCSAAVAGVCPSNVQGAVPYYYVRTGDLSSSDQPIGPVKRTFFDTFNRSIRAQTQIITGTNAWAWETQDTAYDVWGRVAKKSNTYLSDTTGHTAQQTVQWVFTKYDLADRVRWDQVEDPVASNANSSGTYYRFVTYEGLNTRTTNTKGDITYTRTNVVGQLESVTDPYGKVVTYSYDATGNQISVNANGVVSTMTYDRRGRKLSMTEPHLGTWQYRYNALGELRLQQNAKGQLTTVAYDKAGRQTEKKEPDLTSTWGYDTHNSQCASAPATAKGKLTQATTSTGYDRVHCYDALGREVSQRVAMDGNVFWSGTVYENGTGRVLRTVYPGRVQPNPAPTTNAAPSSGYIVRNDYGTLGVIRQKDHSTDALLWEVKSITASGRDTVSRILLGNGLIDTIQSDGWDRTNMKSVGTSDSAADRLAEGYSFDSENNLTARSWNDFGNPGSSASPVARAENFIYDKLNRVTGAYGTTGIPNKSVVYDSNGNITSKDGRTYVYGTTSKPHQITQITGSVHGTSNPTYTYDANGNMLTGGGATVTWMSFDMVDTITQGSQSSKFLYGPEHQRVKQVAAYNGQNITTWYTENFELEVNSTAKTTQGKYYIGGRILFLDTYAVGEPPLLGGLLGQPGPVTETKVTRFMHRDHLGSVVLITGIDGQAVERYSYDVWGKRRNLNGTDYTANGGHLLGATDEGYTGHEHLDHLGLVHMNGRIYDASLGRFMSADPFVAQPNNLQNYNRYAYVNNNPLSYTDPSGYFLKKLFRNKVFRLAATVAIAYYTGNVLNEWFVNAGWFAANSTGLAIATGAGSGFAAGFAGSGGNLKAGLHGGLTGAAFGWAGGVGGPTGSESFGRYLAHAAVGCASSSTLDGGDCSQGAASALAGKYITNQTQHLDGVSGLIAATVAGGTGSVLSGGKFVNGAMTGAFGYLFNALGRPQEQKTNYKLEPVPDTPETRAAYDRLQSLADTAAANVDATCGWRCNLPWIRGTLIHSEFEALVTSLGPASRFTAEVSYKDGVVVSYGTAGSSRADVVFGSLAAPTAVYDLKTGWAYMSIGQAKAYGANLPPGTPFTIIRPKGR